MRWNHPQPGFYQYTEGLYDAIVKQDGELWRSYVYYAGQLIDQGEWDGRGTALRKAISAVDRGKALRSPGIISEEEEEEDDS